MTRSVCLTTFLAVVPALAVAEEYWIAYEGNDFPENEGWTRVHGEIPAERWIEDGKLFIDGRRDRRIYDFAEMTFDGTLDPEPGETFLLRWRLNIHEVNGLDDPGIGLTSNEVAPDEFYRVGFTFSEDTIMSAFEPGVSAMFEPGVFHRFELRSSDMRSYQLYIDGELRIEGVFCEVFGPTRVNWGDFVMGFTSLAEWDYVRFGVVPEPSSYAYALALLALLRRRSV